MLSDYCSLRILATSDIHMQLTNYDYHFDGPVEGTGLCELAPTIEQARAEVPNCLLVDNGDLFQGNPLAETIMSDRAQDPTHKHPLITLMNALDYDVANAGNHDFDFGTQAFDSLRAEADFPFICANLVKDLGTHAALDTPFMDRWVLLERTLKMADGSSQDITIGVVGGLPKETAQWGNGALSGVAKTRPLLETITQLVPKVRRAGADIVVVLSHSGLAGPGNSDDSESDAIADIPGVDAVVAGHVHELYPQTGATVSAGPRAARVMPGCFASHLGKIDLELHRHDQKWHVTSAKSSVYGHCATAATSTASDGTYQSATREGTQIPALVADAHLRTIQRLNKPVGQTRSHLESFFELILPTSASSLVAQAIQSEISDLQSASLIPTDLPIITSVAPFRSGGTAGPNNFINIAPGPISARNVGEIYPFPNKLVLAKVTVGFVKSWMQHASRVFMPLAAQKSALLFDHRAPKYDSELFYGIDYVTHIDRPLLAEDRVTLTGPYWGAVDDEQPVLLATNHYRAIGSGGYPPIALPNIVYSKGPAIPDLIVGYLAGTEFIDASPPSSAKVRISAEPGTSVVFPTGSEAAKHIPLCMARRLTPLGADRFGFLSMQLDF